jgi:ribosomal protein L24E
MYGTNSKGRTIHRGARGGMYVLQDGKKIYKFKKSSSTPPPPPNSPKTSQTTNSKGRTIFKGPKGGMYVLQDGKKIYKFKIGGGTKKAPPPIKGLTSPMKKKLVELAKRVKKRLKMKPAIYRPVVTFKSKKITFKKITFSSITGARTKNSNYEKTLNIEYPDSKKVNSNTTMVVEENKLPLQSWMDAQAKYLEGLSYEDLYTVASYTVRSHQWIGPWLRGTGAPTFTTPYGHILPLYPQIVKLANMNYEDYKTYIKIMPKQVRDVLLTMYVKDLQRIFKKAPPLPRTMYVYRGIITDVFRGKAGAVHTLGEFASAGYVPQDVYGHDRYMRIKLLKGTRVLLLQGLNKWHDHGEFEILLNKGSHYIIRARNVFRPVLNRPRNTIRKKYVTDITVYN